MRKVCNSGNVHGCVQLGRHQKQTENFVKAEKQFRQLCNVGYLKGCDELGIIENRKGNTSQALNIFRQSCSAGNDSFGSCNRLPNSERIEARERYCELGSMRDCYLLGVIEESKNSYSSRKTRAASIDVSKPIKYYEKSCINGYIESCDKLWRIHLKMGNISKATISLENACQGRDETNCYKVWRKVWVGYNDSDVDSLPPPFLLEKACDGYGNTACYLRSMVQEERSHKKSCEQGDSRSCLSFGDLVNNSYSGSSAEALQFYYKACDYGEMEGCQKAGSEQYQIGKMSESLEAYQKACSGGNMEGCNGLGLIEYGKEKKSKAEALFHRACQNTNKLIKSCYNLDAIRDDKAIVNEMKDSLSQACRSGEFEGCYNLGLIEKRFGNTFKAETLLRKSCKGGNENSCKLIGKVDSDVNRQPAYSGSGAQQEAFEEGVEQ